MARKLRNTMSTITAMARMAITMSMTTDIITAMGMSIITMRKRILTARF